MKHEFNPAFDKLITDSDRGALEKKLSKAMTRPAYAYTSMQQKNVFSKNPCDSCGYCKKTEFWQRLCVFPWDKPEEYDKAVAQYLPCMVEDHYEMDRQKAH